MAATPARVRTARLPPLRRRGAVELSRSSVELSGLPPDGRAAPGEDVPPLAVGGEGESWARFAAFPEGDDAVAVFGSTEDAGERPKRWLDGNTSGRGEPARGPSSP